MSSKPVAFLAVALFAMAGLCAGEPDAPPKTPDADTYKLPENPTVKSLVEFCKKIEKTNPGTEAEMDKAKAALKNACQQIITLEKKDTTPDARYARRFLLIFELQEIIQAGGENPNPTQKKAIAGKIGDVKKFLSDPDYSKDDVGLAMNLGDLLAETDPTAAPDYYKTFAALYEKSADPQIQQVGKRMAGMARKMSLVGSEMELKGTTVQGKPFDIASLKGKVVLVDFWATWCHWCIKEIPNVKRNYLGYHGKGFEVVAISADEDRPTLDAFLEKAKLPWINLHDKGGENPAIEAYGITGFPTTFLVGKDGKVVSLSARGKELDEKLKELLGDPDPVPDLPKAEEEKANPLKDAIKEALKEEK